MWIKISILAFCTNIDGNPAPPKTLASKSIRISNEVKVGDLEDIGRELYMKWLEYNPEYKETTFKVAVNI